MERRGALKNQSMLVELRGVDLTPHQERRFGALIRGNVARGMSSEEAIAHALPIAAAEQPRRDIRPTGIFKSEIF